MKLKNILALAVACGAAMVMSVAVHAATEVKVDGAYTDDYGAVVPVVVSTTDLDKVNQISAYEITVNYDTSVWAYNSVADVATYTSGRVTAPMGVMVTNDANNTDGSVEIVYACAGNNGFPTIEDGKVTLCEVYLDYANGNASISDSDFTVGVNFIADYDEGNNTKFMGTDMNSFFTFDVTGDLGGNEVVALGASTDGGVNIQPLEYYTTTNWTEGMDYADATTTFLVAVDNLQGADAVTDITIYGELEDGSYIPLSSLDKSDFLVQTFVRQ